MTASFWSNLRDAVTVWRIGDPEREPTGWKTWAILIVGLAIGGVIAHTLVWATIEGFGR